MPPTKPVLVADPDPSAVQAISVRLRGTEFEFAGSAAHGKALIDAVFARSPWAVVVDLSLPDHPAAPNVGWTSTVPVLKEIAPQVRTVVTYAPEFAGLVPGSLRNGARAFAEKPHLRRELLGALRHAASDLPPMNFHCRARRVPGGVPMSYSCLSGPDPARVRQGISRNLSETGLLAGLSERLPVRSHLQIDLRIPRGRAIQAKGQVVRELGWSQGSFYCGVAIFAMDRHARDRLGEFIAGQLSDEPSADPWGIDALRSAR